MKVGERIKSRRKALGMTQTELANRLGYKDKSAISKIESGVVDVTRDKGLEPYLMGIKGRNERTPKDTQSLAT